MGKKNWIEFDNQEKKSEETAKADTFNKRTKINISKAPYFLKMVEFEEDSYINTLREKLMWGKDRRTEQ